MYQAITTKYLGPTNVHGSRVKATAEAGSVTLSWDHALNTDENHIAAAKVLAEKFNWAGNYVGGALHGTSGYAFVVVERSGHCKVECGPSSPFKRKSEAA